MKTVCSTFIFILFLSINLISQTTVTTQSALQNAINIEISVNKGENWGQATALGVYTPQMAFWVESLDNIFIQNIYVTKAFGKQNMPNKPKNFEATYTRNSLPFWLKKNYTKFRTYPTSATPLPDSISQATPLGSFVIKSKVTKNIKKGYIYFEVNNMSDLNETYRDVVGQPSLIYRAKINFKKSGTYPLELYAMSDSVREGLYKTNISGITTAVKIIDSITVKVLD
jgi:uncharacterized protein YsxB (DUF464 family)